MATSASYWLAERRVLAVGADNMAWDVPDACDSELGVRLPGHLILLAWGGIYIIENLQLEELAAESHRPPLRLRAPAARRGHRLPGQAPGAPPRKFLTRKVRVREPASLPGRTYPLPGTAARTLSMAAGFSMVERSPGSRLSAMAWMPRLSILPLLVLGRASTK